MLQLYPLESGEEKFLNIPVFVLFCFVLFFLVFGRHQKQRIEHKWYLGR
jgi:preprotein translocase subunit YajC